ncbi:glycosyltransferase family 2 protein [Ascidiaceihabitans sp.]|nr:glycosyltransferase family 2 protein [Ascidiaceihabitans sp.]
MPCSVSVVVVSRDRPDALYLCVLGLSQVQYNAFEIVVVADAKGLAALDDFKGKIKAVQFDDANISMARNIGIVHSAGEIVAFIDDVAVPEPTWLTYLTAPFSRGEVSAVVDSYVSWKIAKETGQWKLTDSKSRKDGQATFEDDEFTAHLEALQAFQVTLLNTLQAAGQTAFMCHMKTCKALKS